MNTIKVLWTSRHQMTEDQVEDLKRLFPDNILDIESKNITWKASKDANHDYQRNLEILETIQADIIVGVFPPVMMEMFISEMKSENRILPELLTPISEQAPELRIGDEPIPFRHVRFAYL